MSLTPDDIPANAFMCSFHDAHGNYLGDVSADEIRRLASLPPAELVHSESGEIQALVERINGLYAKATPGPWKDMVGMVGDDAGKNYIAHRTEAGEWVYTTDDDIDFIVALANTWPQIAKALQPAQEPASHE